MSRRNRRGGRSGGVARPFPSALDHPATRFRRPDWDDSGPESDPSDAFGGVFSVHHNGATVRSLIRTVLPERGWPVRPSRLRSPLVPVRASMRSSGKAARSPFLNATTVTPQLAERAITCAKRTIRREVLFATRRTGAGSASPRRPKSKVKC